MRDVVLYTLLSLDGVAEEPGNWMFEADEDVFRNLADVIGSQDTVLLGRGTFDYWAGYWPTSEVQPFADFINTTPKHVVSSSPLSPSWSHSTLVDEDPVAHVAGLRAGAGGDIGVHGSIRLAQTLLAAGQVDRLELVVVPTLAGEGRRLFTDGADLSRWSLARAERSATGCVFLGYRRA